MSRTGSRGDSGHESQEDNISPDPLNINNIKSATVPHRFTNALGQDKVLVRPVAFKPITLSSSRFTNNGGQRYGSTPSLARPASHLTLYGSSSDLRKRRNYSLDRKKTNGGSSPLSSLPLRFNYHDESSGTRSLGYDSGLDSVYTTSNNHISNLRPAQSDNSSSISSSCELISPESPCDNSLPAINNSITYSHLDGHIISIETSNHSSPIHSSVITSAQFSNGTLELEAVLRERDSELAALRQTMETNEQVIFRVYQEKERAWDRELRRIKGIHQSRLRASAEKANRLEQLLIVQTYQIQQDKKRLREDSEKYEREASDLRKEMEILTSRLDEVQWKLCQKSGEISLLKSQLKNEKSSKNHELISFKNDMKKLNVDLDKKKAECENLKNDLDKMKKKVEELQIENLKLTVDEINNSTNDDYENNVETCSTYQNLTYKEEINRLKEQLQAERDEIEKERQNWTAEKEKVLKYQRQLQVNYVQMYLRNQYLEEKVEKTDGNNDDYASITCSSIQL